MRRPANVVPATQGVSQIFWIKTKLSRIAENKGNSKVGLRNWIWASWWNPLPAFWNRTFWILSKVLRKYLPKLGEFSHVRYISQGTFLDEERHGHATKLWPFFLWSLENNFFFWFPRLALFLGSTLAEKQIVMVLIWWRKRRWIAWGFICFKFCCVFCLFVCIQSISMVDGCARHLPYWCTSWYRRWLCLPHVQRLLCKESVAFLTTIGCFETLYIHDLQMIK